LMDFKGNSPARFEQPRPLALAPPRDVKGRFRLHGARRGMFEQRFMRRQPISRQGPRDQSRSAPDGPVIVVAVHRVLPSFAPGANSHAPRFDRVWIFRKTSGHVTALEAFS
jgi:hypothetical protein